jgi:ribose transport system ATP-binding protein
MLLDDKVMMKKAEKYKDELNIKYPSILSKMESLSGGNQQKCIIARWLLKDADIFIFDEPTKGIDIGAKSEIYSKIKELVQLGKSIILISSELEEITQLCDRVVVMREGSISKILDISEASQENIMKYAVRNAQ